MPKRTVESTRTPRRSRKKSVKAASFPPIRGLSSGSLDSRVAARQYETSGGAVALTPTARTDGDVFTLVLSEVSSIRERISGVEQAITERGKVVDRPSYLPITSFEPEPYDVLRPIWVTVEHKDDCYEASFFDANVHASGDNEQEAFDNIKSLLLDLYDRLAAEKPSDLGRAPKRQFAVLSAHIRSSDAV